MKHNEEYLAIAINEIKRMVITDALKNNLKESFIYVPAEMYKIRQRLEIENVNLKDQSKKKKFDELWPTIQKEVHENVDPYIDNVKELLIQNNKDALIDLAKKDGFMPGYQYQFILDNLFLLPRQILHYLIMTMDDDSISDLLYDIVELYDSHHTMIPQRIEKEIDYFNWYIHQFNVESKPDFKKNASLMDLLSAYSMREKGKVVVSRKELRKRFDYCSYGEQILIISAFMDSHIKKDIEWCCRYLEEDNYWKNSYLEILYIQWEEHKDNYNLAKAIIPHLDDKGLKEMIQLLDPDNEEERKVRRAAIIQIANDTTVDLHDYNLSPSDFVYISAKTRRSVTEDNTLEAIFFTVAEIIAKQYGVFTFTFNESHNLNIELDNKYILWAVGKLKCANALMEYAEWMINVTYTVENHLRENKEMSPYDVIHSTLKDLFPEKFGYLLETITNHNN